MYIPEEMKKVNAFQDVAIPSNKSFFARLGEVKLPDSSYSGDDLVPEQMRKVDSLADYERYAEMMAKEEGGEK